MKPDEAALWQAVLAGWSAREAGRRMGIPAKRVQYLCRKWGRKGIYDWGTVCDIGWAVKP